MVIKNNAWDAIKIIVHCNLFLTQGKKLPSKLSSSDSILGELAVKSVKKVYNNSSDD